MHPMTTNPTQYWQPQDLARQAFGVGLSGRQNFGQYCIATLRGGLVTPAQVSCAAADHPATSSASSSHYASKAEIRTKPPD